MSRKTLASDRRRRKAITALWALGLSIGVIFLIVWELTAILYILATLGVTALLLLVAFADLGKANAPDGQAASQGEPRSGSTRP